MGKTKSLFFTITNGVRQGGILSPKLFSIYMDDLSKILNDNGIGCHVDNVCVNHVFTLMIYVLMAPSAIAFQQLLNICHRKEMFFFTSRLNVSTNSIIRAIENCWLIKYVT